MRAVVLAAAGGCAAWSLLALVQLVQLVDAGVDVVRGWGAGW